MNTIFKFHPKQLGRAVFVGLCAFSAGAYAAQGAPGVPGGGGGGKPPPVTETGANNLSFPVILGDNVGPAAFPADGAWRWAPVVDPLTECIGEEGVAAGTPVPPQYLCYYGRHVSVSSEEGSVGDIVFDGDPKVWWLQKRTQNFWKTLSVGHDVSTPLVVSAVDVGDLLESSPAIQARQIRVEFNMLQHVDPLDTELGGYTNPANCVVPTAAGQSIGCFAAFGMSGAVPGTEQSGNEMQGTDFGPGPAPSLLTGTQTLLDPAAVRLTDPDVGGIQALVYSHCARLVIQKITGNPTWDQTTGQWSGAGVGAPVVNVATYSATSPWTVEITSGGSIVYGYNWNAKSASTGMYRLTFVLDGNDAEGPQCTTTLATTFQALGGTTLVNSGENNPSNIVYAGDSDLGDEGGLVYIDLILSTKGGGKKN